MNKKRINPRRRPASEADIKRAQNEATDHLQFWGKERRMTKIKDRLSGKTLGEVAAEAAARGMSYGQYVAQAREEALKQPEAEPPKKKAARNINADASKMTERQIKYAALRRQGMTYREIGKLCGVSHHSIGMAIETAMKNPCRISVDCDECTRETCQIDDVYAAQMCK